MNAHLLLALAMMGPSDERADARPGWHAAPWTASQLREEFQSVVNRVRKEATWIPDRDVPDLVLLRGALERDKLLTVRQRADFKQRLDYWLEKSADRLKRTRATASSRNDEITLGGPAEMANAQQLIDLIESTIQPDSWDVNGGPGTIRYYSPLHVLVIRNTQPVHREIGGVISVLGAQQR
jgi:hypothetical protein